MDDLHNRRHNDDLRDIMIEVRGDLKNLIINFSDHKKLDEEYQKTNNRNISWLKNCMCIGIGGLLMFELILKVVK